MFVITSPFVGWLSPLPFRLLVLSLVSNPFIASVAPSGGVVRGGGEKGNNGRDDREDRLWRLSRLIVHWSNLLTTFNKKKRLKEKMDGPFIDIYGQNVADVPSRRRYSLRIQPIKGTTLSLSSTLCLSVSSNLSAS